MNSMQNNSIFPNQTDYSRLYLIGFFLLLILPLAVTPPWLTPIGWGKTILFRIILSILLFFFLYQILSRKIDIEAMKSKLKSISPLFLFLIIIFGSFFLSTVFSSGFKFSLWGDPLRSGGFVNFSFYLIFTILIFLILKKEDWQKFLDLSIIVGILVSIVAIFQQFGIYSKVLLPFNFRPVGTIGNPVQLSLFLLLLTFISLAFFVKEKARSKRIFYFISFALFILVSVIFTQTRASFLGLIAGFLWLFFAYPKKFTQFKITLAVILVLVVLLMFYLDSHFYLLENQPYVIKSAVGRILSLLDIERIGESRISVWKISLAALKEKPIFGWGPENFKIGFDKYYDSSLPGIGLKITQNESEVEWWDRAHNLPLDIAVSSGIPSLLLFLAFFGILLWKLQQLKIKKPENQIIVNGVQATLIGYLVASLASFDVFDTYLLLFLLIGYSFLLISEGSDLKNTSGVISQKIYPRGKIIIVSSLLILIWFIFFFNIKPIGTTKGLNDAFNYERKNKCEKALELVNEINSKPTIAGDYLAFGSVKIIQNCISRQIGISLELDEATVKILEKTTKDNPQYTQNWFLLGKFTNYLLDKKIKVTQEQSIPFPEKDMEDLKNKINNSFEKASSLSPKRVSIYREWANTGLITKNYDQAKEKTEKCIELDPDYGGCYWLMGLISGYLGDSEKTQYYFNLSKERDYDTESKETLEHLINMYFQTKNLQGLKETYPKAIDLITDNTEKAQLLASLAFTYAQLGEFEKARETALKILEISPSAKSDVDTFLQSLPK